MRAIHCLNPISKYGTDLFTEDYQFTDHAAQAQGILVRSASMHGMDFSDNLRAIARAGAGVNNIPLDECAKKGIVVFNTPGANANGVKELVVAGLLLASRDIVGGIKWCESMKDEPDIAKLTEKEKKAFAGCEVRGKRLGVIGLGAIGAEVANAGVGLGMEVYGYDPYMSVDAAWMLSRSVKHCKTIEKIYQECDYITLHVPLIDQTKGMICQETLAQMKDGVVILNFSRDVLVNEKDIGTALKSGKVHRYVTDFPNSVSSHLEGAIVIPHLGASTEEAEDNCAKMAVKQLKNYLEHGNIKNAVNFPNCDMGHCHTAGRLAVLHLNVPKMIGQITGVLAEENINISDLTNKSRDQYAYTLVDIESKANDSMVEKLKAIQGVLRVRVIC